MLILNYNNPTLNSFQGELSFSVINTKDVVTPGSVFCFKKQIRPAFLSYLLGEVFNRRFFNRKAY